MKSKYFLLFLFGILFFGMVSSTDLIMNTPGVYNLGGNYSYENIYIGTGVTINLNQPTLQLIANESIEIHGIINGTGSGFSGGDGGNSSSPSGNLGEGPGGGGAGKTDVYYRVIGSDDTWSFSGQGGAFYGTGGGNPSYSDQLGSNCYDGSIGSPYDGNFGIGSGGGGGMKLSNNGIDPNGYGGDGGDGGGAILLVSPDINITGSIINDGNRGSPGVNVANASAGYSNQGGGGGSGGSITIYAMNLSLNPTLISVNGGDGGLLSSPETTSLQCEGTGGSSGRIKIVYENLINTNLSTINYEMNGGLTIDCNHPGGCDSYRTNGSSGTEYTDKRFFSLIPRIIDYSYSLIKQSYALGLGYDYYPLYPSDQIFKPTLIEVSNTGDYAIGMFYLLRSTIPMIYPNYPNITWNVPSNGITLFDTKTGTQTNLKNVYNGTNNLPFFNYSETGGNINTPSTVLQLIDMIGMEDNSNTTIGNYSYNGTLLIEDINYTGWFNYFSKGGEYYFNFSYENLDEDSPYEQSIEHEYYPSFSELFDDDSLWVRYPKDSSFFDTFALQNISVLFYDNTGIEGCSYSINGTANKTLENCTRPATWNFIGDGSDYLLNYFYPEQNYEDVNMTIYAWDYYGNIQSTTIEHLTYINDTISPIFENLYPSNTQLVKENIVAGFRIDEKYVDTCIYSINKNYLPYIENTVYENCSDGLNTFYLTVDQDCAYQLNVFVNDTSGNENSTTHEFSVNSGVGADCYTSQTGGGGGGTGGTTNIIVSTATQWEMLTSNGESSFQMNMVSGITKEKSLRFQNFEDTSKTITLSCQDIEGDLCQFVDFEENPVILPLAKDIYTYNNFLITTPLNVKEGDYSFMIIGTDKSGKYGVITTALNVKNGFFYSIIVKLTSNIKNTSIPYLLILFILWIIFGILLNKTIFKKLKASIGWSTVFGLITSFIIIGFI